MLVLVSSGIYGQDSCCVKYLPSNNEGFSTDERLDLNGKSFLKTINVQQFRFTNDYTGNFRNPGTLFNELDFSSYDLLNANLSFSDKNNAQKIVFSPFRLLENVRSNLLLNTRFNVALKNNITTIGLAIGGDNSDPRLAKFDALRKRVFSKGAYCIPECYKDKNDQEKVRQQNQQQASDLLYEYDMERTRRVFKWSIGYNTQLFSILSSKGDSPVTDSLNFHGLKSHNFSGSASYSLNNGQWVFSAGYNYILSRKSAEKGQDIIPYQGVQLVASYRIVSFLKGERLKSNENFIKSLYIPSLNLGLSYEYKTTNGDVQFIEDGIQRSRVITPFIDVLITPSAQFRIGIPITKNKTVIDQKTLQVGALLQYSFKLTSL